MDDPKTRMRAKEPDEAPLATQLITLTAEQFAQLLGTRTDSDDFLKKQAQFQAEATKKALRPENEAHPGISVYNPLGERDHPNPDLKCKVFWCGYPELKENLTREEVIAFNAIDEPGEYLFHRTDGSVEKATVEIERDARGAATRLLIGFPCQGQNKHNLPSKLALLAELHGQAAAVGAR